MQMMGSLPNRFRPALQAIVCAAVFLSAGRSIAANLNEPIFRIATEGHTSDITRAATDAQGRWLATVSSDKTLMIWRMPAAERASVLRVPIGTGDEGKLDTVAMSPDGRFVAVSGMTGLAWSQGYTVYILERESGHLVHRITGLSAPAADLRWSAEGKLLAIGLKSPNASVMLYRSDDWTLVGSDADYDGAVGSVEFLGDGRMLTTASDGLLRLYTASPEGLRRIRETTVPGGAELNLARVHPDGTKIAVNFRSSNKITVIDARTLKLLYAVDTGQVAEQFWQQTTCDRLAWSPDGRFIYRGGVFRRKRRYVVDAWDQEGRGARKLLFASRESITDLVTTPGGGVTWTASDGVWGSLQGDAMVTRQHRRPVNFKVTRFYGSQEVASDAIDYDNEITRDDGSYSIGMLNRESNLGQSIQLSDNGNVVSFVVGSDPSQRLFFDVTQQAYLEAGEKPTRLNPFDAYWVKVSGTGRDRALYIMRQHVKMSEGETPVSLVLTPKRDAVYVGSQHALHKYQNSGRLDWRISTEGEVVDLAASADGRMVVAALNDGTLRWYQAHDGKELLALFPHSDRKRWVMWVPEGHYSSTLGAEDLIGWHLNQGNDREARFLPSGLFYDVFYRPDIVQAKFRGDDISGLITLTATEALKNPPPVLSFTKVPSSSRSSKETVCYKAASTGGGIGEVRLFQNGKLVKSDGFYREAAARNTEEKLKLAAQDSSTLQRALRGLKVVQKASSATVSNVKANECEECQELETIPGENEVSVAAFNAPNTIQSSLETAHFNVDRNPDEPHLYVLAIGIDRYRDPSATLQYAVKDSNDFLTMIRGKANGLYQPQNIHDEAISDDAATKAGILAAIQRLSEKVKPWDSLILFVASHGVLLDNQYYIVTAGFNGSINPADMISSNEIVGMSTKIKSLSQLFIFDTCHAGGVDNIISGLYDARMSVMAKKMGLHIYASAGTTQAAMDGYQGNGLFTHALLKSMKEGEATDSNHDSKVSVVELGQRARQETLDISKKLGFPQSPKIINFGRDNALFKVQ